jgi:hypothetical protein
MPKELVMPMIPFIERFPELGAQETRYIVASGKENLPDGEYAFVEFYCDEPGCDCRRVLIDVLRSDTGWKKIWATINYGWESREFYRKWASYVDDREDFKGPVLDMLNPQSQYSEVLLDLFRVVLGSPGYVERLRKHYAMFRESIDRKPAGGLDRRLANRQKRLRDPRRRPRH